MYFKLSKHGINEQLTAGKLLTKSYMIRRIFS